MKESNNNAVDLLLRSLARRERSAATREANGFDSVQRDGNSEGSHLDADELNLFAEGVLPEPARARYAEHLADCGRCRGLVVNLAQAAGTAKRYETADKQAGVGVWEKLASLFSSPVLRYGFPALLLTAVIGVGLFAFRDQRQSALVARNEPTDSAAKLNQSQDQKVPTGAFTVPSAPSPPQSIKPKETDSAAGLQNNPVQQDGLIAKSTESNSGKPGAPEVTDSQDSSTVRGVVATQPVYAPAPPPPPKVSLSDADKAMVQKDQIVEREELRRDQDGFKIGNKDDSPTHGPSRSRAGSIGGRRSAEPSDEERAAASKDKKEAGEDVETQTVSGRRFVRRGQAWVDSAYHSSHGITTVTRGSEQFRALMADEPGLRAIVQRFGGEVIVVWENRAYRFR